MLDRRSTYRRRVCFAASLQGAGEEAPVDCRIRDLSDRGAMLVADPEAALPRILELGVPRTGTRRRGRVVWRRSERFGVEFIDGSGEAGSRRRDAASGLAAEADAFRRRLLDIAARAGRRG